jgi:hypothetical protein
MNSSQTKKASYALISVTLLVAGIGLRNETPLSLSLISSGIGIMGMTILSKIAKLEATTTSNYLS